MTDQIIAKSLELIIILLKILPRTVIFYISNLTAFILFRIIKYRKKTTQKIKTMKLSYSNLTDNLYDSLKSWSMNPENLRHYINIDLSFLKKLVNKHKRGFICCGHYANWELCSLIGYLAPEIDILFIYKKTKLPITNNTIKKYRQKFNTRGIETNKFKEIDFSQEPIKPSLSNQLCK